MAGPRRPRAATEAKRLRILDAAEEIMLERGYAVPRLQHGRTALVASLILAVLIAGWHLPLMVAGQIHYSDIVLIIAAVIVFNWVFNNTNGSVLIIMLLYFKRESHAPFYATALLLVLNQWEQPGRWRPINTIAVVARIE